jgi:ATP-binding protein involved in chromosome partitioning
MRIAIPVSEGKLDPHFGHCRQFALVDMDRDEKKILAGEIGAGANACDH